MPIPDQLPSYGGQGHQTYSDQYPEAQAYFTNSLGKKSLQGSLPPVPEENEEAAVTPLEVTTF